MAENETLLYDARSASRWRPIGERIDGGELLADLFPIIQDQFYASLQKVWKQWKNRGVDPEQLFQSALTSPQAMRDFIKQMSFDRDARLLQDVAASIQHPNKERLIFGFLEAAWDGVETQLQLNRRDEALSLEFVAQVQRMLSRIATSLLNNLSRFPNRPSRNEPPPDLETRLGESLL